MEGELTMLPVACEREHGSVEGKATRCVPSFAYGLRRVAGVKDLQQ